MADSVFAVQPGRHETAIRMRRMLVPVPLAALGFARAAYAATPPPYAASAELFIVD